MKITILVVLIALGLIMATSFAFAADTAKDGTATAKPNTNSQIWCCGHYYVDANNDGICDVCGMKFSDIKNNKNNDGNCRCSGQNHSH